MFEITVESEFCAAHALSISGVREAVHGHNWRVTVTIAGDALDPDGLLCDFHTVQDVLADVLDPFQNADLNKTPPFDALNPSAEHVARHIAEALAERLDAALAPNAAVSAVRVTEAPGCATTYRPRRPDADQTADQTADPAAP